MKFQILSDLHDEFYSYTHVPELISPQADALILAGDITTPHFISRLRALKSSMPIYYVLGNHEFYNGSWDNSVKAYKDYLKDSNIHLLEDMATIIHRPSYSAKKPIRIIGSTLWTDFWAPGSRGNNHHGENCQKGMNDFFLIKGATVDKWEWRHKNSLRFMHQQLSEKFDGPTIIITHHAPSFKSNHPAYKDSPISGGFCSNLDGFIDVYQPTYWIHGHAHESFDYKIGETRIICNPKGYPSQENKDFKKDLLIEL